jgi:hypothetical protein
MDNKLERTLFQSVKKQTSRSSLKKFVVENTTNILLNLWFRKLTFLEEPSTSSFRLLNSNSESTF